MIRTSLAALAALAMASPALAADLTPEQVVQRHIAAGGDVDKIVADYADDAVVMQQGRILDGKDAIRAFYTQMMGGRRGPPGGGGDGAPAGGPPPMKVTKIWQEGDVGFVTWEMGPVHATEEFLVRGGKIQVQAVFMSGMPGGPPRQ